MRNWKGTVFWSTLLLFFVVVGLVTDKKDVDVVKVDSSDSYCEALELPAIVEAAPLAHTCTNACTHAYTKACFETDKEVGSHQTLILHSPAAYPLGRSYPQPLAATQQLQLASCLLPSWQAKRLSTSSRL